MKYIFSIVLFSLCLVNCASANFTDSDLNQDGVVNRLDLYELVNLWLNDCFEKPCFNVDIEQDEIIDFTDFAHLSDYWQIRDYNSYQVAYWPFNEGSGSIAHDSTSHGRNAAFRNMNSSSWTTGKRQGALYFDGSNDYLSISELDNGLGQFFQKDFSIALWVNQYSPQSDYQVVIGVESTSRFEGTGFEGFTIEIYNGIPSIYIAYADTQREIVPASVSLPPDQWQHLCVVREGASVRFYLDGKLDACQTITDANIKFGSVWPGYDVIGATKDSYFGVTGQFKGKLDDIHLYNFAIPESLVHKLAQQDYAWLPEPENNSANVSIDTGLYWQKGLLAANTNCHDVYLGTNSSSVQNATTSTTGIYRGRQTETKYIPAELALNTQYYWRIDTIDSAQTIHKGSVWNFKTSNFPTGYSVTASSSQTGFPPEGAFEGNRFETVGEKCWKGASGQSDWFWQIEFNQPPQLGSLLMIMGVDESVQQNCPTSYMWKYSSNGLTWYDLTETCNQNNKRVFRVQRLNQNINAKYLRLEIYSTKGNYPTIREIELYNNTNSQIPFDDWLVGVCVEAAAPLPAFAQGFFTLARYCTGWENVQAQELSVVDFNESFLNIEPYPLCVFLSGSLTEWCQVHRPDYAGLQEVILNENIPIWGSCGGGQVIGLLVDPGWQNPWDCPRCRIRDNHNPAWSPIYGHIGYLDPAIEPQACGYYDNNIYEIGDYRISQVVADPVFAGLANPFYAYEYHCGQLEYLPAGWHLIGTAGAGTLTQTQCFRRDGKYIYGAQFHIENYSDATWSNSLTIMSNFLQLAQDWGGYNEN